MQTVCIFSQAAWYRMIDGPKAEKWEKLPEKQKMAHGPE